MIFAQQAIHRHPERVFNPDRKDPHWGKHKPFCAALSASSAARDSSSSSSGFFGNMG
jgi:hypothetical protein